MNCVLSGLLHPLRQVIAKIPFLGCDEASDSWSSSVRVLLMDFVFFTGLDPPLLGCDEVSDSWSSVQVLDLPVRKQMDNIMF